MSSETLYCNVYEEPTQTKEPENTKQQDTNTWAGNEHSWTTLWRVHRMLIQTSWFFVPRPLGGLYSNLTPSGEKQSPQSSLHTLDLSLLLQMEHKHKETFRKTTILNKSISELEHWMLGKSFQETVLCWEWRTQHERQLALLLRGHLCLILLTISLRSLSWTDFISVPISPI